MAGTDSERFREWIAMGELNFRGEKLTDIVERQLKRESFGYKKGKKVPDNGEGGIESFSSKEQRESKFQVQREGRVEGLLVG